MKTTTTIIIPECPTPTPIHHHFLTLSEWEMNLQVHCKQCRPRSEGFWRNPLIRVCTVCHNLKKKSGIAPSSSNWTHPSQHIDQSIWILSIERVKHTPPPCIINNKHKYHLHCKSNLKAKVTSYLLYQFHILLYIHCILSKTKQSLKYWKSHILPIYQKGFHYLKFEQNRYTGSQHDDKLWHYFWRKHSGTICVYNRPL